MTGKHMAAIVIGGIGLALFGCTAGWLPALAVFLMLWGNNLSQSPRHIIAPTTGEGEG